MKFHFTAKICLIFLYGCASVCQTYAAYIVEVIPYAPEDNNLLEDSLETTTADGSAVYADTRLHVVPEEINLDMVSQDAVKIEKHEDHTMSPPPSTTEDFNSNTDSPPSKEPPVTEASKTDKVTIEGLFGSCTEYKICINGDCRIGDCNEGWEVMIFDRITKRCRRPMSRAMDPFAYRRCRWVRPYLGRY